MVGADLADACQDLGHSARRGRQLDVVGEDLEGRRFPRGPVPFGGLDLNAQILQEVGHALEIGGRQAFLIEVRRVVHEGTRRRGCWSCWMACTSHSNMLCRVH